tara:strand:+ start:685 stop:876 length:192 start_codon:yes stop_codon:yes gene_type:complete
MRERNHPYDSVIGYAFLAIVVLLIGLFWYFATLGAMLTADKAACSWQNIGQTCIVLVIPEADQ